MTGTNDVEPPTRLLPRALGLWDAICVVVGAIIGVGIFFNPKDVAHLTGSAPGAMLAWGLGGLVALLGAFTFAELGRLRPFAGDDETRAGDQRPRDGRSGEGAPTGIGL